MARRAQQLADELRDLAAAVADREALRPSSTLEAPPPPPRVQHEGRTWFNTTQAGERADMHPTTVLKKLESGVLHGRQRTPRGRWRIHVDCLDAWIRGEKCGHQ